MAFRQINHPLFPYPMKRLFYIFNCIGLFLVMVIFKLFKLSIYQNTFTLVMALAAFSYLLNVIYYRLTFLKINRGYTLSLFIPVINVLLLIYLLFKAEPVRS